MYKVVIRTGADATDEFEVEADSFREELSKVTDGAPWMIFYRDAPITVTDGEKGEYISSPAVGTTPTGSVEIEVFRTPLHSLLAVELDDTDEDGEQ